MCAKEWWKSGNKKKVEFDSGSEWMLVVCLTHASRTKTTKIVLVAYRWVNLRTEQYRRRSACKVLKNKKKQKSNTCESYSTYLNFN